MPGTESSGSWFTHCGIESGLSGICGDCAAWAPPVRTAATAAVTASDLRDVIFASSNFRLIAHLVNTVCAVLALRRLPFFQNAKRSIQSGRVQSGGRRQPATGPKPGRSNRSAATLYCAEQPLGGR